VLFDIIKTPQKLSSQQLPPWLTSDFQTNHCPEMAAAVLLYGAGSNGGCPNLSLQFWGNFYFPESFQELLFSGRSSTPA